jgi:hypothetical protein
LDDHEHSTSVSFSNGGTTVTGSRLDVLKASFDARPRHSLMREFVDGKDIPAGSAVLFHNASEQKSEEISPERIEEIVIRPPTSVGRSSASRRRDLIHILPNLRPRPSLNPGSDLRPLFAVPPLRFPHIISS